MKNKSNVNLILKINIKWTYPPIATIILTLTLYCTIIPRFSFWVMFRILIENQFWYFENCSLTQNIEKKSYIVDEAKFVSSCFNFPSNANPLLSLLFANNGVNEYTFVKVEHGVIGNPSLKIEIKSFNFLLIE